MTKRATAAYVREKRIVYSMESLEFRVFLAARAAGRFEDEGDLSRVGARLKNKWPRPEPPSKFRGRPCFILDDMKPADYALLSRAWRVGGPYPGNVGSPTRRGELAEGVANGLAPGAIPAHAASSFGEGGVLNGQDAQEAPHGPTLVILPGVL